ncbi:transcriptional regulator [Bacillus cereus]|uniref:helix-turn-helix transcriptional regulator n=1 Tax=Bacillus TaxID=1386 RepID=UPI000618677A|nr:MULTISPECIES: helix-turn-helix transcriptional regulator [Bacillus]KXY11972.1 transcriptional regulator [Bacillus cereus]KKC52656.1 DNA-binding protein [Bacillus sp. UMTAT18]MCC2439153.1 helix-turn-helix transcriptional regulator [Bacillus paranthracis]MCM0001726.1 helix-turn-helix transcriptional regulator [Bacillus paranthracis]MCU5299875.1 helix-turn-helix transcriptional regulator [Bacillus paranthracis]
MNSEQERKKELGNFLKSRRNRLSPQDFGLPISSRRKAKGLRREEVAQLANIGVTWYTWIEQGRDIQVSIQALESLADALRLDKEEREHMFLLAHQQLPPEKPLKTDDEVSPVLQNFIDDLKFYPIYVTDQLWDVVTWNRVASAVFGDFETMSFKERNAVWRCFASQEYRTLLANDWEAHARRLLAQFRATCSRFVGEEWLKEVVEELMAISVEFQEWWPAHDVLGTPSGKKEIHHPIVGTLLFEHITFRVYDAPDLKLTMYRPKDPETLNKLRQLLQLTSN